MKKLLIYLVAFFAFNQARAQQSCYEPDSLKKAAGTSVIYTANSSLNFDGSIYTKFIIEFISKDGSKYSYEKSCQLILCNPNGASIKIPCSFKEKEFILIKGSHNKKARFEFKARTGADPGQVVLYGPLYINGQEIIKQLDFYIQ